MQRQIYWNKKAQAHREGYCCEAAPPFLPDEAKAETL